MKPQTIEKIKSLASGYDPEFEHGEYWDSGNFDDCFQIGVEEGMNSILLQLKNILEEDIDEKI